MRAYTAYRKPETTYLTHSQTTRGWLDLHQVGKHGRTHRTVTWQDRSMLNKTDGKLHMMCNIYANGNMNTPIATIPMDGNASFNREELVFNKLDEINHPSDTNIAFDFSIVENDIEDMIKQAIAYAEPNERAYLGGLIDEENPLFVTHNGESYRLETHYGSYPHHFDTIHAMAAFISREMYPIAAQHEHDRD